MFSRSLSKNLKIRQCSSFAKRDYSKIKNIWCGLTFAGGGIGACSGARLGYSGSNGDFLPSMLYITAFGIMGSVMGSIGGFFSPITIPAYGCFKFYDHITNK